MGCFGTIRGGCGLRRDLWMRERRLFLAELSGKAAVFWFSRLRASALRHSVAGGEHPVALRQRSQGQARRAAASASYDSRNTRNQSNTRFLSLRS